jgi:hypothetical protein
MATLNSTIVTKVRSQIIESAASFWTDAEILTFINDGQKDLWRAILDLHQEHFAADDESNVSLDANSSFLAGIPGDCFRILTIEQRDLTASNVTTFTPRDFNHPDFQAARSVPAQSPSGLEIFYTPYGAGPPVAAMTVKVAPQVTSAVLLRVSYARSLDDTNDLAAGATNPIPGDSDNALFCYAMAYATGKQSEGNFTPDPEWLSLYATEKKNLLVSLTPRQEQEPDVVEGYLEEYW